MANLSTYAKGELIKHMFRTGTFTKPTELHVALFVGATEVTGGSYARVQVGPSDAAWADQTGGDGVTSNLAIVTFPTPTGSWGLITNFKIMDAASGGNSLVEGTLASPKNVNNGDAAPNFPIGALIGTFS